MIVMIHPLIHNRYVAGLLGGTLSTDYLDTLASKGLFDVRKYANGDVSEVTEILINTSERIVAPVGFVGIGGEADALSAHAIFLRIPDSITAFLSLLGIKNSSLDFTAIKFIEGFQIMICEFGMSYNNLMELDDFLFEYCGFSQPVSALCGPSPQVLSQFSVIN